MRRRAPEADGDVDRIGPVIERGLEAGRRRLAGQHFTHPDVADLLLAFCIRGHDDVVVDPACGTGSLLTRARARRRLLSGGAPDDRGLVGIEIDQDLARAARLNLPGADIVVADFLCAPDRALPPPGTAAAVVANPPYVRQELIGRDRKASLARRFPGFSGRSDLHVFFWLRAAALLREGGRMGFLTSSTWLDAAYGDPLRRWIAQRLDVVAVVEPGEEAWFGDARVRAAITIVQRAAHPAPRPARFVRLRDRLDAIVPSGLPARDRLAGFDALARELEVEAAPGCARVRIAPAADLAGRRWGPLLRAPGLCDDLVAQAGDRMAPLGSLASVEWGIKTGDDRVFFVDADTESGIEASHLVPAVFSLMDLDRVVVTADQLRRRLLLVDLRDGTVPGPGLRDWIARAEIERRSHRRPTCAARDRSGARPRRWFELRPGPPGAVLWSIMHQYRHLAPINPHGYQANDNLLRIRPREGVDATLLAAVLNANVQALLKQAYGRSRNEGMLKMQACDVKRMPVPDPRRAGPATARRLRDAFASIAARRVGRVIEEIGRPDRRALDLAVLSLIGLPAARAAAMSAAVDEALASLHGRERRGEVDAVARRRSVRATRAV